MIKLFSTNANGYSGAEIPHKTLRFPGGEIHVTIDDKWSGRTIAIHEVRIHAHLPNSNAVMELLMLTDAVKREFLDVPLTLHMPYVPYARQDRVANWGEALGIRVFCDLINAQKYSRVYIQDPHSDVTTVALDRVVVEDPLPRLRNAIDFIRERHSTQPVLVSPDAGARKRTLKLAQALELDVIFADKTRNTKTGEITGTVIQGGVLGTSPLLVVDDICDGGRTFIELAKVLPPGVSRYLYVTHGIFSKGIAPLMTEYDLVFSPNNWTDDKDCISV